jgi:hypothetical protein
LPAVSSIDPEVTVQRHDAAVWEALRHSHQAGISQRDGNGIVALEQPEERRGLFFYTKRHSQKPPLDKLENRFTATADPPQ